MNGIRIAKAGAPEVIAASDGRLTLSVPIQIKRRGARKPFALPNNDAAAPRPWDVAARPMQLALAKAHRWLAMLESGDAKSITAPAAREKIDNSHVGRLLNLTTIAPDIVAAIRVGSLPPTPACMIWRSIRRRGGRSSGRGSMR